MDSTAEPQPTEPRWRRTLVELFGIDPRCLAVFRIAMAGLLLFDLLVLRTASFGTLYTDAGVLPRRLLTGGLEVSLFPFHLMSGSFPWQATLHVLLVVSAFLLLIGLGTRIATVLCWVLLASLQIRNPLINNFGDEVLRHLLFWSMFLPLGRVLSLDARRAPPVDPRAPVLSAATAALLLQVAFIYFFTGVLKSGRDWWPDGRAVWYTINVDYHARALGVWLRNFPALLQWTTWATLVWEWVGPWLLFSPVATRWLRGFSVAGFAVFQIALMLSLHIGLFQPINLLALVPFLPRPVWDRLIPMQKRDRPIPMREAGSAAAPARLRAVDAFVGLVLLYVLVHNVNGVRPLIPVPGAADQLGYQLRINQRWAMYSPNAPHGDGWMLFVAQLSDGRRVDLSARGPEIQTERPERLMATHDSYRWSRYVYQLRFPDTNHSLRRRLAWWLCQGWNAGHGPEEQAESVELIFMYEATPLPGGRERIEPRRLVQHDCRDPREP